MTFFVLIVSLLLGVADQQEPAGRGRGRGSPPQPQQKQGVDYFVGTWSFTWTGRESPVTAGPREGTTTYTRGASGSTLDIRSQGTIADTNGTFSESGTAAWDEAGKVLALKETLANGTVLAGSGDWASPLAIRYVSEPAQAGKQQVRIRRTYTILSAQSFSIAEEISIDGGPFQRLGNGLFTKQP